MAEGEARQYWVRNDRGTVWGPLTLLTIELLIENGSIQGRIQLSTDGLQFAFPWRFPEAKEAIPRELWGDGAPAAAPAPQAAPAAPHPAAIALGPTPESVIPGPPPGVAQAPMAGPGAAPMAGPGAMPMAGPGARMNADPNRRPVPPTQGARPGPPVAAPPVGARPGPPVATPRPPPVVGAPGTAPQAPQPAAAASARPVVAPAPAPAVATVVAAEESPFSTPAQGSLEQLSPIRLYGRIGAGEQTGLLTLTLSDRAVQIHFRKGNPEFVDSSHPEDALGTSLLGARLLTPEQLQQAESAKDRFGGELLGALFGLGILQPATAFTQLAQRATSILSKGVRAESGAFSYEPKDLPGHKAMPLGNRWSVLGDVVRRIPTADIKRRLTPVLQLPVMKSGGLVATSDLRLTPHEVRSLTVIDGVRSVAQLLNDFPQDADHLLRLVYLLKELDAVSFAAPSRGPAVTPPPVNTAVPPPTAAAPKPAGAAPAAGPGAAPKPVGAAPAAGPGGAPKPAGAAPGTGPGAAPKPAGAPPGAPPRPAGSPPVAGPGAAAAPRPGGPSVVGAGAAPKPAGPPVVGPPGAARPPPTVGPSAAAAPAGTPGAEEIPALRQLATVMKQQNHFQRLSLTEQAEASAVKIAYFRLAKLYHPDTLPPGAPPELEKLKAEVFGYIGDAYRTLTDDKSRAAYLEELKSGGAGQVDVQAILHAEELFQRSTILVKARKFPEAVKMLDEAVKLNPDEAEFYAWRGYARFFLAPDKKAAQPEAFREIQNAIKRNERCAPAHYFLGVIAKLCGDAPAALKHFKRTVELQPDHIDAQREIRMATQKK